MNPADLRHNVNDTGTLDAIARAVRGEAALPLSDQLAALCPYRGLQVFREEDSDFFCGREEFTQNLLAAVQRRAMVALVGSSGNGKSSVLRAGLLPLLRRQGPSSNTWDTIVFTPLSVSR